MTAENTLPTFPNHHTHPNGHQPGTFTGVPSFIRAHCHTASRGGSGGYAEAGFHLGYHVRSLEPLDLEEEQWLDVIETELRPLVDAEDAAVLGWLMRLYPRVMALVPRRRRVSFVAGFCRGFAKGGE